MLLNEDWFEDIVDVEVPDIVLDTSTIEVTEDDIVPSGPVTSEDSAVADMLLNLINDENDAILGYNSFNITLTSMNLRADFIPVINDIINEEMNHIGMLQKLLQEVSPNASSIDQGKEEATDLLDDSMNEGYIPGFGEMMEALNYKELPELSEEDIDDDF